VRAPDKPTIRRTRGRPSGTRTSATKRLRRLCYVVNRHVAAMAIQLLDESRAFHREHTGRRSPLTEKAAVDAAIWDWNERWSTPGRSRPDPGEVGKLVRKGKGRAGDLVQLYDGMSREMVAFIRHKSKLRAAGVKVPEIDEPGGEKMFSKWLAHPTSELDEIAEKNSPFQVRSATVRHRRHGGVIGGRKGRGQGL
jgi:hypothetical protein